MAMQIFEDNPEFQATATSITQAYNIIGVPPGTTWDAVKAALLNYAPASNAPSGAQYQWPQRGFTLKEIEATQGIWKGSITWASLTYQYALKIGGQQQQIRCDLNVVNSYPNPNLPTPQTTLPEFAAGTQGAAVGYDGNSVHGTSIYVPQRNWSESVEIPIAQYSFAYEDAVFATQAAPVNSGLFRGYAAGEVIFLGMNAQLSTQNPNFVTASYDFSMSPNNSAANKNLLTVGPIGNIAKDGWDYLDVRYDQAVSASGGKMAAVPSYVVVHRLYKRSDFTALNIGTSENMPLWGGS